MGTPNDNSFAAEVDSVVNQLVKNEEGKLVLPEGVEASEQALYAAKLEIRRRDTYSSFSKVKNENALLAAENAEIAKRWEADALANLSPEASAELAELKASDVDAYIAKKTEHVQAAKEQFSAQHAKVRETVRAETELERRSRLVEEHNKANPNAQLTQEVIDNDIPPRMLRQVEAGEMSFDQFIEKATAYLTANKVIGTGEVKGEEPNLSKAGGSHVPDPSAVEKDIQNSYKKTIF